MSCRSPRRTPGALEVSRALAAELPGEAAGLVSFEVDDGAADAIADRLNGWFALDPETRAATRAALRETAVRLWSWEGVARSVIEASAASASGNRRLRPAPR